MSVLDTLIRDLLAYAAMPLMFLLGFIGVSVAACLLLGWIDRRKRRDAVYRGSGAK